MITYNVTSQIAPDIQEEWIDWMQNIFIPKVLDAPYFCEVHILKVHMDGISDPTYAVQFKSNSNSLLKSYLLEKSVQHKNEIKERFGNQVLSFETKLELLSKHS